MAQGIRDLALEMEPDRRHVVSRGGEDAGRQLEEGQAQLVAVAQLLVLLFGPGVAVGDGGA